MRTLFLTFMMVLGVLTLGPAFWSVKYAEAGDVGVATQPANKCPKGVQVRKEIRTLTTEEWNRFLAATKKLMSGASPTAYDRLVKVHLDAAGPTHTFASFFPWHRAYLRDFEQKLQAIDPAVTLPYWNSTLDSQAPENALVFAPNRFGGNGSAANRDCVTDGAFAGWYPHYPTPHCLQRKFNDGTRIKPFVSSEIVTASLQRSTTYDALRRALEFVPHGTVHNGIGGDMARPGSFNDPIAWLADAYWDKLWADWQRLRPANMTNYGGTNLDNTLAKATDALTGYSLRVQDVFDTRSLCYVYQ